MHLRLYGVIILCILSATALIMLTWIIRHPSEATFSAHGSIFDQKISPIRYSVAEINNNGFIYTSYLAGIPGKGFLDFEADIKQMDALYPSVADAGQQLLFTALADSLEPTMASIFNAYKPDSLLLLLEWVVPFRDYASSPDHALFYNAVHSFWLNKIAITLSQFAKDYPDLPYSFKFQYLSELCARNAFHVNVQETNLEKVKKNLLAGNWSHLIHASWHDSPVWGKFIFILLFLITVAAYLSLIKSIIQFTKK